MKPPMRRPAKLNVVALVAACAVVFSPVVVPRAAGAQEDRPPEVAPTDSDVVLQLDELRGVIEAGEFVEAESRARELLSRVEAEHGPDSLEAARVMYFLVQSMWRGGKAMQPEVLEMSQRSLAIKEDVLGPDDILVAAGLIELANVYSGRREYEPLDRLYERALEIYTKALGPDDPNVAIVLHNRANALVHLGEYSRAQGLYEQEIAILEKEYGPDHPETADALSSLAGIHQNLGKDDYITLFERSLAISEKALGPDHPNVANTLSSFGLTLLEDGKYLRAKEVLSRSLVVGETSLGEDHPQVGGTLINLGILFGTLGDPERAAEHLRRAVSIAVARSDPYLEGVAQGNLGIYLMLVGEYLEATQHFERAKKLLEETFGPQSHWVAWILSQLGEVKLKTADFEASRGLLEESLDMLEATVGDEESLILGVLSSLGEVDQAIGDTEAAGRRFNRALEIAERVHGPSHPSVAEASTDLAAFDEEIGDMPSAGREYERALAIYRDAIDAGNPEMASPLEGLARIARAEGNTSLAIERYERALEIQEQAWGPDYPGIAATLVGLAETLVEAGELERAFYVALRAENISRQHRRVTTRGLAEREALRFGSIRNFGLHLVLALSVEDPVAAPTGPAFDNLIRSRAVILDEMARRNRLAAISDDPEVEVAVADVSAARSWLAHLTVRGPGDLEPEQYRQVLAAAQEEKELAERELASLGMSEGANTASEVVGLEEVAASLLPGEAMVAIVQYDRHPLGSSGEEKQGSPDPVPSFAAFVLRGGQIAPVVVDLGEAEIIDRMVFDLRRQIVRVSADPELVGKREVSAYRRVAEALRAKVWDPAAPHLDGAATVLVVPDGSLNLVSFAALPVGEDGFLIDRLQEIRYLSAERDLVAEPAGPAGLGLLALGDPSFDSPELLASGMPVDGTVLARLEAGPANAIFRGSRSSCGDFRRMRFGALPASAAELDEVVKLWSSGVERAGSDSRLRGPSAPRGGVIRLDGSAAGEAAFKIAAPGRRGLHLATHGFFLGGSCRSALDSAEDGAAQRGSAALAENPLLFSGLALAGANRREEAGPGEEDGILTAEEIASLDLSGVRWAVLSACDTGIGDIRAGEGVFGLRRAFRVAGVETLVTSLWPVHDEASRAWMKLFYEQRFAEGRDTAAAVHRASLELLNARRAAGQSTHPFFWAGFVAAGR